MKNKVYEVTIQYGDEHDDVEWNVLFATFDSIPDGYTDEDIYFYGLSREETIQEIGKKNVFDFIITNVGEYDN